MDRHSDYAAIARTLDQNGFAIWPKLLPEHLIDAHIGGFDALMARLGVDTKAGQEQLTKERIPEIKNERYRFHREHQPTLQLMFNEDLVGFLRYRFNDEPVLRQPQTGYYQQHAPAHTESMDIKPQPRDSEVRVWCALEDVNPAAGPVYFVPRSHNLVARDLEDTVCDRHPELLDVLKSLAGPVTLAKYGEAIWPVFTEMKNQIIPELVRQSGLKAVVPELSKGDVVIFRTDVVHGTCECADPQLTRKYLTAFWSATNTRWYHTRAWWGRRWDFRVPENSITAPIEQISLGSRIEFTDYYRAYWESFSRPIYGRKDKKELTGSVARVNQELSART